ncbi:uncharacterized protein LOC128966539 [Oppia nitens]|uniref:uncharacterized protein LOC128966539 n=1 Tax=Oppia nitens TaxID=1686743 RepID=UPI0023DC497F|nr:uncharacterized protein LOC128966539 [Oppia nitens]
MAIIEVLNEFQKLGDSDFKKRAIYETHIFQIIQNCILWVICSLGIYSATSERFRRILEFGICITAYLTVDIILLFLNFSISDLVVVMIIAALVTINWLYLHQIFIRSAAPIESRDERIFVDIDANE